MAATQPTREPREDRRGERVGSPAEAGRELMHAGGATAGLPLFAQRAAAGAPVGDGAARGALARAGAQGKLALDTPGDAHEREADAAAHQAGSGDAGGGADAPLTPAPAGGDTQLAPPTAGAPLSPGVRAAVEPVVGADLRHVRVHGDPEARETASALQARAFTSGTDIWLGPGERADDVELMAHEAAHVVQQGHGGGVRRKRMQRKVVPRTNDGELVVGRMNAELEKARQKAEKDGEEKPEPKPGEKPKVDPAERAAKKRELGPKAKARDRAGEVRPTVTRAAESTKAEAKKPPEKKKGSDKGGGGKGGKGPLGSAQAGMARQAFAAASAIPMPPTQPLVVPPKPVRPLDAGGKPLPSDPRSEARVLMLAAGAQQLRLQAMAMRASAADERANALTLRGNIAVAQSHIADSEHSVTTVQGHVAVRRGVEGKAKGVHELSEQKAEQVASGAPGFVSKAAEGKEQSGPMATESADLAGESKGQAPDDDEAAGDAKETSGQLSDATGDLGTIDSAIGQTGKRAETLAKDAALAKQKNAQSQQKIDATDAVLAKTDAKLGQMKTQNAAARTRLAGLSAGPAQHDAGADALDQQALSLIRASEEIERRLHHAQQSHEAGMRAVPASKPGPRRAANAAGGGRPVPVQRRVAGTPDKVDLKWGESVSDFVDHSILGKDKETEAQRQEAMQREQKRRQDEIAEIEAMAGGNFAQASATDKLSIALRLTGRRLWNDIAGTNWAHFGGNLLRGFVDPSVSLMGIVSGLSMTLSGFGTIYKQWERDPLGAVLTGAAQIATGVTITLGSIAGLAFSIVVILTAIAIIGSIFSFGAVGAALAPFIAFFGTVASTVGGWALVAAAVALVLNALVFIKDLIDAATAGTAAELQMNVDALEADSKNMGNMALQLGMAKVMQMGGKALANTRFGQAAGAKWGGVKQGAGIGEPAPAAAPAAGEPAAAGAPEPAAAPAPAEPAPTSAGPAPSEPAIKPAAPVEPGAPAAKPPVGEPAAAAPAAKPSTPPAEPPAAAQPVEAPVKPAEAPVKPAPEAQPSGEAAAPASPEGVAPAEPPAAKPAEGAAEPAPAKTEAPAEAPAEPAPAEKPTKSPAEQPAEPPPKQPAAEAEPIPEEVPGEQTAPEEKPPEEKPAEEKPEPAAKRTPEEAQERLDKIQEELKGIEERAQKLDKQIDKARAKRTAAEENLRKARGEATREFPDAPRWRRRQLAEAYEQAEANLKAAQEKVQKLEDIQRGIRAEKNPLYDESIGIDEELHPEKYPKTSNEKGDIGEAKADEWMAKEKGFKKIGSSKEPATGEGAQRQGLDGVYENPKPPPRFVVGEAKYGAGRMTPEQSTKGWVDPRLEQAVGPRAAEIRAAGYEYWELHYDPVTDTVTGTKIW